MMKMEPEKESMKAQAAVVTSVPIDVAPAELIDKMTVLAIKAERLTSDEQLQSVRAELAALRPVRDSRIPATQQLDGLIVELRKVNEVLWDLEEVVRRCDAVEDFGESFVQAARAIIHANNRRVALKRAINALLGARFQEEKSYPLPDPLATKDSKGTGQSRMTS
jgi:hypothetical protein